MMIFIIAMIDVTEIDTVTMTGDTEISIEIETGKTIEVKEIKGEIQKEVIEINELETQIEIALVEVITSQGLKMNQGHQGKCI